jgi:hypothetical protein
MTVEMGFLVPRPNVQLLADNEDGILGDMKSL